MADNIRKTKKRKRTTSEIETSVKDPMTECRPTKTRLHSCDELGVPVIAITNGLLLSSSLDFQAYTKSHENALRSRNTKDTDSTELLLQSSQHPRLDYVGREEDIDGRAFMKHFVGVYDAETNKLDLMEARKIVVKGTVRERELTPDSEDQPTYWAMKQVLGQAFGSKKSKKAIAALVENAATLGRRGSFTIDAATKAVLETMEETTKHMSTREQLAEVAAAAKPRPLANTSAQHVKDVYTMDSLIESDVQRLINVSDWADALANNEEIRTRSRFVANRLQKAGIAQQKGPDASPGRIEKLKMLRYLLLLIEFRNLLHSTRDGFVLPKRSALHDLAELPSGVIESVKRKFCGGTSLMSQFQVDLLLTHVCALACVVDNFEVDMWDLKEDLNLEMRDMSKYFKEIGAKITPCNELKRKELKLEKAAAAQRKIARLKLPLEYPKLPFARRR